MFADIGKMLKLVGEIKTKLPEMKAKLDRELAKSNLALLENYTNKRKIDQLTSDIRQAEMALERDQRRASADVVQAEAQLRARDADFTRQKTKLKKLSEVLIFWDKAHVQNAVSSRERAVNTLSQCIKLFPKGKGKV